MPAPSTAPVHEWPKHFLRVNGEESKLADAPSSLEDISKLRRAIEPWLSAVFQAEHFSLLLGSGFTTAVAGSLNTRAAGMANITFGTTLDANIDAHAKQSAIAAGRGAPNIEDQIRSALALRTGLEVLGDKRASDVEKALNGVLSDFTKSILESERKINNAFTADDAVAEKAKRHLVSFLLSFASRAASRERLNIFTTNYDRLIEYACDLVGLRVIDRFVGGLSPVYRSSRIEIDMHYNPPGIRGEPRYLEGVVRLSKLHGSLDWKMESEGLRRIALPFGADSTHPGVPSSPLHSIMIYPNPAKDSETQNYPYADLFRDFSTGLCRPNSVLVTYGYGFGDDHINRVIRDMLTIPSTHLVVISYDTAGGRVSNFVEKYGRDAQVSLLIGSHFASLPVLVDNYLPKPAIDQISWRQTDLLSRRGAGTVSDKGAGTARSGTTP